MISKIIAASNSPPNGLTLRLFTSPISNPMPMTTALKTDGSSPVNPKNMSSAVVPVTNWTVVEKRANNAKTTLKIRDTWNPDAARAWDKPTLVNWSLISNGRSTTRLPKTIELTSCPSGLPSQSMCDRTIFCRIIHQPQRSLECNRSIVRPRSPAKQPSCAK